MRTFPLPAPVICWIFAFLVPGPPTSWTQEQQQASRTADGITLLDAVKSTLELHPLLQVQQKQVDISRALHQQSSADFDTHLLWSADHKRSNTPLTQSERNFVQQTGLDSASLNLTTMTGAFSRLLRSGIVIGPRLEVIRTTGNLESIDGTSRTRLSFDVNVPLWRGRGKDVVTARETSAQIGVEGSLLDLNQTIADLILTTATSYWGYVGAAKRLEIFSGSETRAREYVDNVELLIKGDKLPRSEIYQVRANLAGRTSDRISVEQQLAEARHSLGLAMGLSPGQVPVVPPPSDAFPDGENQSPPPSSPESIRVYIDMALTRRADVLSAEKKRQAADVLRTSARNSLMPQLDFLLSSGYAGLQEGRRPDEFFSSMFTHTRGPDILFGLRYSLPLSNNLAQGQLAEAEASYQQTALLSSERAREVAGGVSSSLTALYNGVHRLKNAREAVSMYQAALDGERDKLRLAAGSLTDLLTVESRLTSALIDLVGAQEAYAVGLARFRHATGTLVAPDRTVHSIDREVFFTAAAPRPD